MPSCCCNWCSWSQHQMPSSRGHTMCAPLQGYTQLVTDTELTLVLSDWFWLLPLTLMPRQTKTETKTETAMRALPFSDCSSTSSPRGQKSTGQRCAGWAGCIWSHPPPGAAQPHPLCGPVLTTNNLDWVIQPKALGRNHPTTPCNNPSTQT